MIPIVSLVDALNGLVALGIAAKLLRMYDGQPRPGLGSFIAFYLFLALFWFTFMLPDLVLVDIYSVSVTGYVGYGFLFAAMVTLAQPAFIFFGRREFGVLMGGAITVLALVFYKAILIAQPLSQPRTTERFTYWIETYDVTTAMLPGVAALLSLGSFVVTFTYIAGHADGTLLARAAKFFVGGGAFLAAATAMFFLILPGGFLGSIAGTIFSIIGLFLMARGITLMSAIEDT